MKYIIKLIIFIFYLFILIQYSYGENKNPIKEVSYQGYLTGDTVVNIQGNLKNCKLVSISGKIVKSTKEDKQISFIFGNINNYNGIILTNCNGELYKKEYFFPNIKNYQIYLSNNIGNTIKVEGENFKDNANIVFGGNKLNIIQKTDRLIIAKLPEKLKNNELYIYNGKLKSNLLKINIKIPEINYIKSDNGFKLGTTLSIYTNNFNFSSNNFIVINNDKYQLLAKNYKNNHFVFKVPEKYLGKNSIYIIKDGIKSNTINIKIFPKAIPIIKQITAGIDKDSKKILKIKGENFINSDKLKVKLGKNGSILKIKSINNNEIVVFDENKIKKGNNFIYIELSGILSNIYNYIVKGDEVPFIGKITTEGLTPDNKHRIFKLTVNYFNKKTDKLLLNTRNVNFGYYGNIIKATIDKNITKGTFGFSRNEKKLNYIKKFDFSYNFTPIIKYIKIKGELKPLTKIEIIGKNFLLSNISANNLLGKKKNGLYDIVVTDSKITGYLPKNFNINQNSNIIIQNNGEKVILNFNLKNFNKKIINGPFILNKIINDSNNFTIKQGDIINIFGSYFHNNDKIFLNDKQISFTYINPTQIKIKLDDNINPGIYELKIKNNIGIETKLGKFYIFNKKLNPKIKLYQEKVNDTKVKINPITQEEKNNLELNYKIENKLSDLQINKVIFKVKNYNPELYLNLFDLYYNNNFITSSIIDDKGNIIFNTPFVISKNLNNNKILTIKKDSPYIKYGKVNLILEKIDGVFLVDNKEKEANNNIEINNLNTTFEIISDKQNTLNCIDNHSKIISCEKLFNNSNLGNGNIKQKNNTNQTSNNSNLQNNNKTIVNQNGIKNNQEKIKYLRLLVNSKHKLNKTNTGKKYLKQINILFNKYKNNKKVLNNFVIKIPKIQEKIKNKKGLKYIIFRNIFDYLYAKSNLELLKIK